MYEENDKNDFFEDSSEVPEKKKEPKKPVYKPEDPRYWDQPEDEFEHLKMRGRVSWKVWVGAAAAAIAIGVVWGVYIRMFTPYIEEATQYGYVEHVDLEGDFFKTFEGTILPYKNLMDTTRVYEGDLHFSTSEASVAARLKENQFANRPVRITYKMYKWAMPWRGNNNIIITAVDSVDERNILPPDRQPGYLKEAAPAPVPDKK